MKKAILCSFFALTTFVGIAQIKTPKPSPAATIKQNVGLTEIEVNYSRPSVKGRKVFGNLVPYNSLWRTGANNNTILKFSTPVVVGDASIEAGAYALYTRPSESKWEIIFYKNTDNWGLPEQWDKSKVAASIKVDVIKYPLLVESFTIAFENLSTDSADLTIKWENSFVKIPLKTPANKTILSSIENTIKGTPNAQDYYTAAVYLSATNQNIKIANKYMDKAMKQIDDPKYWQLRQQSLILAKVGDKDGAVKAAELSLTKAIKAGNKDYIKLNTDSIKEWSN